MSAKQIYCYRKRTVTVTVTVTVPMLTHSHSATSLYNLGQSAIRLHRVHILSSNVHGLASCYAGVLLCLPFWLQKYLDFVLNWLSCFLAILFAKSFQSLSTWKLFLIWYVVKYHIFLLIHLDIVKPFVNLSLCNILNSQNIAGNIANKQYQRKLMFSGDYNISKPNLAILLTLRCSF